MTSYDSEAWKVDCSNKENKPKQDFSSTEMKNQSLKKGQLQAKEACLVML